MNETMNEKFFLPRMTFKGILKKLKSVLRMLLIVKSSLKTDNVGPSRHSNRVSPVRPYFSEVLEVWREAGNLGAVEAWHWGGC